MTIHLLIAEDARDVAEGIVFGARMTWPECRTTIAPGGGEALDAFEREGADLVVLDVAMPPPDGFEVLRRLRARSAVPILMLTVRDDTLDKVRALEGGADDYLTKPFDPLELMARLQALLRRANGAAAAREDALVVPATGRRTKRAGASNAFIAGDLTVDYTARQARLHGELVRLTPTEYRLLEALTRQAGTVLPHRLLLKQIWGEEYVGDVQSLKVFVRRLRQKLGDDPEQPRYIQNEWGTGYRFIPPGVGTSP